MAKKKAEKVEMATERIAKERAERMRARQQGKNSWYPEGKDLLDGIAQSDWIALGYTTSGEWMRDVLSASKAKVYRYMRAVKYLTALDEDRAEQISEGNARLLTMLKPEDANSEHWIQNAEDLTLTEMRTAVYEHRYTVYGFPRPEKWINPWPKIPETGELIAEEAIKNICLAQEIDPEKDPEKVGIAFMHFLTVAAQSTPQDLVAFMED